MFNIDSQEYELIIRTVIKILAASSFVFAIVASILVGVSAKNNKGYEYTLKSARELFGASLITKYTFLIMIIAAFLLKDISTSDLLFYHQVCFGYFILSVVILFVSISSKYISGAKKQYKSGNVKDVYSTIKNVSVIQISGFYVLSLIFA